MANTKHDFPHVKEVAEALHGKVPYVELLEPCSIHKGVHNIDVDGSAQDFFALMADKSFRYKTVVRFVPASGAASRMFAFLYENADENNKALQRFFQALPNFAFYPLLKEKAQEKGMDICSIIAQKDRDSLLYLLGAEGLHYLSSAKGAIPFHKSEQGVPITAFEEQIVESIAVLQDTNEPVRVHFSLPHSQHQALSAQLKERKKSIEKHFNTGFSLAYSDQLPSTDVPCLLVEADALLRDENGELVMRPGGHGALLHNVNELQEDIIFIKNIDNVVRQKYLPLQVKYKQALAGFLLKNVQKIQHYLKEIDLGNFEEILPEMKNFVRPFFLNEIALADNPEAYLVFLNRPIRVCGVVENTGANGGGPFWLRQKNGVASLQIVEKIQINLQDPAQKKIFEDSAFFNPVDIVAYTTDFKGVKFDLTEYTDKEAFFISEKKYKSSTIRIFEHPGLWNGSMADWLTFFVQVPIETFNPVKTVNDLLDKHHQI